MARHSQNMGIAAAIPGARASLRWHGWSGIVALMLAASMLALGVAFSGPHGLQWLPDWVPLLVGLAALATAGYVVLELTTNLRRMAELAQVLCDHNAGPVFVKDAGYRHLLANDAADALFGYEHARVIGRRVGEVTPGPMAMAYEENDRVCLDRGLPALFRASRQGPDGERSFLISKFPLHDTRGRITGLVGIAREVTDELELQDVVRRRGDEARVWFEQNPLPVLAFAAADRRIVNANAAAVKCYGYDREALLRMHLADLFAPAEAERLEAYLAHEGRALPPGSVAWKHRRADGRAFDVLTNMGSLLREPLPVHLMLVRDVSAVQAARSAQQRAEARYADLVGSDLALFGSHDFDGRLTDVNAAFAAALGYEPAQMIGRPLADFIAPDAHGQWQDYLGRVRSLPSDAGVLQCVARNGEPRAWQYRSVSYPDASPAPYVLLAAHDVTLRHRYELRIRNQNRRDPLTGCRSRAYLDAFSLQATADEVWGCVVVDVDYFRQLNASEGRARGDEVLRDMARLLKAHADGHAEVVRMGGDEFAVLLPQATTDGVIALAERLGSASRDGMPAVFSLGWAIREAGEPLESTLRRADKLLLRSRMREGS